MLSLITQFGGGKTHTLTALYHLVHNPKASGDHADVRALLKTNGLSNIPKAKPGVFVGNAWDPSEGRETPWIDVAWQLAGAAGVEALGPKVRTSPPGTEALGKLFQVTGGRVLLLFDEVLNFFNRHRDLAEGFYAFLDNSVRAMTATTGSAAIVSLPRSQIEMTDFDQHWLDRISKVVHRVAKDLIANDESEIAEVVRRRLFEDLGKEKARRETVREYAEWCFERRAQLPPEWTAVDTVTTDVKARELLRARFEASYPFHPATISVFQRKWQGLPHYQRTRGTLAMFAQWISWASREAFSKARKEPLITLGSAPLQVPDFQAAILGQLGEQRLLPAIEVDIAGERSHARALDTGQSGGPLKDVHRRVGAAILFESTGVASDRAAHLPELRFAIGEPGVDITSIDNAAHSLETRAFYIRKIGTDGFRIGSKPTLKKLVGDRRAALDEQEVLKTVRAVVKTEFESEKVLPVLSFPADGAEVPDTPKLTVVVVNPEIEWEAAGDVRKRIGEWTRRRGSSNRLHPAALVWVVRKPGRALRDKAEVVLAWHRVDSDLSSGVLGTDYGAADRKEVTGQIRNAQDEMQDEVWASYRYAIVFDPESSEAVREIDLGAGHASQNSSLTARVLDALKAEGLLTPSVGASYVERNWPVALKESGAWPLKGLRQCFLNGTLTRLRDPEELLKQQIVLWVGQGTTGLASGPRPDGNYDHVWWKERVGAEEVSFDDDTFLLLRDRAEALKQPALALESESPQASQPPFELEPTEPPRASPGAMPVDSPVRIVLRGNILPELWNKLGTRLIPKLRSAGQDISLGLEASVTVRSARDASYFEAEIRQALAELGMDGLIRIDKTAV